MFPLPSADFSYPIQSSLESRYHRSSFAYMIPEGFTGLTLERSQHPPSDSLAFLAEAPRPCINSDPSRSTVHVVGLGVRALQASAGC